MKKAIKNSLKFNSKKGMSLLELIVAIIIIMIVVSASVSGLSLSYRSVLLGAAKDDAQSVAQRDCDIVMNALQQYAEEGILDDVLLVADEKYCTFNHYLVNGTMAVSRLMTDTTMSLGSSVDSDGDGTPDSGYNSNQYYSLQQYGGDSVESRASNDYASDDEDKQNKKFRYLTITKSTQKSTNADGEVTYTVYHVETNVFYTSSNCSTCEGDVIVKQ